MSDNTIALIIFPCILIPIGIGLIIVGFKFCYKYLVQEKRCNMIAKGYVTGYTLFGNNNGVHLPIVSYFVDGQEYKVKGPEYRYYSEKTISSPTGNNTSTYYEKNDVLHIERHVNSFLSIYSNPLAEMYPIGAEVRVFYDAKNPKLAYVERYCNRKFMFWGFFSGGTLLIAMAIITIITCI